MTRAKYNSPNQLFRSLDLKISFSEFLDKMKSLRGNNFFEMYNRDELSYEQIQAVFLPQINIRRPSVLPRDVAANSSNVQRNNTLKTLIIVGALGYITYTLLKKIRRA